MRRSPNPSSGLRSTSIAASAPTRLSLPTHQARLPADDRIDLPVGADGIVELEAIGTLTNVGRARALTCLRLIGKHVGLPITFDEAALTHGVRRFVL